MDNWMAIVPPLPRSEAEARFRSWEAQHSSQRAALRDADIRVDIIRSEDGSTLVRYCIRRWGENTTLTT